jgi:hypothetical protein
LETRQGTSWLSETEPASLLSILVAKRGFGVSNSRDMVYGHLAVAGLRHSVKIDSPLALQLSTHYERRVSEIFTDATRYIIESTQSLEILLRVDNVGLLLRRKLLPSWVSD